MGLECYTYAAVRGRKRNTATTLHGALVRVSKRNLGLRRDMEAVAGAFTRRKKATAQDAASPTATENAEATTTATAEPTAPPATAAAPVTATPPKGA